MAASVVVHGAVASATALTTKQFLLTHPRGAYTACRTIRHGAAVVAFAHHMSRLAESLRGMLFSAGDDGVPGDSHECAEATRALRAFRDARTLTPPVIDALRVGIPAFWALHPPPSPTASIGRELRITVLLSYDTAQRSPVLDVHIASLPLPTAASCVVQVSPHPRNAASVKDSQWVRERAAIEASMVEGTNEVVLVDDDERVYEGLTSNFYAFVADDAGSMRVVTAPDGTVLTGTVLKLVEQACAELKVLFIRECPRLSDARRGGWTGAFITSTSRGVLPIHSIILSGHRCGRIAFDKHPVIDAIRDRVKVLAELSAMDIL